MDKTTDIFLEKVDYEGKSIEKEKEADDFAIRWTFSKEQEETILQEGIKSEEDLLAYAKRFNTHPAIIVGRLQHEKHIPYSLGNRYIVPIELDVN